MTMKAFVSMLNTRPQLLINIGVKKMRILYRNDNEGFCIFVYYAPVTFNQYGCGKKRILYRNDNEGFCVHVKYAPLYVLCMEMTMRMFFFIFQFRSEFVVPSSTESPACHHPVTTA